MYLSENTLLQGGKYKIVRFISSGGFGNTYEGVHTLMNTRVAIKEFFPKIFCKREEKTSHVSVATQGNQELVDKLRKKFNEEATAVFQMKHDNIVRVLDTFEENGTAYYVMEYIDGKSLNTIIKESGALPEAEAVDYVRQVADAIKYVHSLNRLHLDIKPGNIMVDKKGKATLIDFGASKHYDLESGENTSTLMGVNTTGYAPAEQSYRGFVQFSASTDIYALGATLYKLLTGITPPDAQMLKDGEIELSPLPSDISASVKESVIESMRPLRKNRPQTIDRFVSLLIDNAPKQVGRKKETVRQPNDDCEDTIFGLDSGEQVKTIKNQEIENEENTIRSEAYRITTSYGIGYSYLVNIGYVPQYANNCSIAVCKAIIDKKDTIIKNHEEELARIESQKKIEKERKLRQRANQIREDCNPGLRHFFALFILWGYLLSVLLFILAGLYIVFVSKNYENGDHNMENMLGWGWFIAFFYALIQHKRRHKKNIEDWKKNHSSDPSADYL